MLVQQNGEWCGMTRFQFHEGGQFRHKLSAGRKDSRVIVIVVVSVGGRRRWRRRRGEHGACCAIMTGLWFVGASHPRWFLWLSMIIMIRSSKFGAEAGIVAFELSNAFVLFRERMPHLFQGILPG